VSLATLAQAMEGDPSQPGRIGAVRKGAAPDDVASLIFTSGTTGTPKGVMLTHRNFASLVPKLAASFDFGVGDGLLSVLPLHHTFEFSAGMLTPFSRGAEVTYLDELTTDRLGEVLESGHVTAMIGVPALWTLFPPEDHPGAHRQAGHRRAGHPRAHVGARRAPEPAERQPGQDPLLAGAPEIRRPHQVPRLGRLGADRRRPPRLPRPGLRPGRGLRPHRGRAGAERAGPGEQAHPGKRRQSAARHRAAHREPGQ
jgi:hypothetical protein